MKQPKLEEKLLASGVGVVTNPEVIKITVIKKKHLEQISKINAEYCKLLLTGAYKIVGAHSYKVIVINSEGHLGFFHNQHILGMFRDQAVSNEEADPYEWSNAELQKIPQIFGD